MFSVDAFVVPANGGDGVVRRHRGDHRAPALDRRRAEGESRIGRGVASFDDVREDVGLSERDVEEQGAERR